MPTPPDHTPIDNLLHNLKWLRQHLHLTKKEMARQMHIGTAMLNTIEQGVLPKRLGPEALFYLYPLTGIAPHLYFAFRFDESNCPHCKNSPCITSKPL